MQSKFCLPMVYRWGRKFQAVILKSHKVASDPGQNTIFQSRGQSTCEIKMMGRTATRIWRFDLLVAEWVSAELLLGCTVCTVRGTKVILYWYPKRLQCKMRCSTGKQQLIVCLAVPFLKAVFNFEGGNIEVYHGGEGREEYVTTVGINQEGSDSRSWEQMEAGEKMGL